MKMLAMHGTERAMLATLAATIAAGIDARPSNLDPDGDWLQPEVVARRAVMIAAAIIAEVEK
jgi:hypothetical protein